ncbi:MULTISPECIES: glycerol-3-phosphate dehydrogenase/oxidase [unclassified Arenibacter]|uniref:glycerol-3-phosphate dehydrogenase/oxidase n=1 Tax=unclassified Arenibacter TaxID=2615047 RepID=UPI000E34E156|nr:MULTISPECIES: glycerol-3-phosphate dehydrogenase/oxidase [unclassified Arenibacter]MCM4164621.1 glycerol-3-phosphate dehydrogenase [Arenibacter sp. A80]RFT55702.1 glycerol-3-phosphate dehydrogenase/oxidase [Arenibacter sp. P308M17]
MMDRKDILNNIRNIKEISVLIVGAGINGAGLYRELTLQGIPTILIDKHDFSSGASAASSRMIHGGLRYLENNEAQLVKESLMERNRLILNAAHYVKPLPTTIPIFSWFSGTLSALPKFFGRPTRNVGRGALIVKLGLSLYDFYTRKQRILPKHIFTSRKKALGKRPELNPGIIGTATYFDAWISYPERLCLELIKDSNLLEHNSLAINYMSLEKSSYDTVVVKDKTTGECLTLKPDIVVNATGAWIDLTNMALGKKSQFIGGTKGSHLVIDNKELIKATQGQMLFYENEDGRICILFPFQGKVLVGSTDIKIDNPEEAICHNDEVEYMLNAVKQIFPNIKISNSDVVFQFCGVRPLPNSNSDVTAQISRNHSIEIIPPSKANKYPIYSLVGGKWTTFRAFSEKTADDIFAILNVSRRMYTRDISIGGGKNFPKDMLERKKWIDKMHSQSGLSLGKLETLLERYGTEAEPVVAYMVKDNDQPLEFHKEYTCREIMYLVRNEYVVHLDDLILRRTTIALLGELTYSLLKEIGSIVGKLNNWSENTVEKEINRTVEILSHKHNLKLK